MVQNKTWSFSSNILSFLVSLHSHSPCSPQAEVSQEVGFPCDRTDLTVSYSEVSPGVET